MRTTATHSSSGSSPAISRPSAEVTGASTSGVGQRLRQQRHRLAAPPPPAPPGAGSRRRARPGPAARRRVGCGSAAPARWPPDRPVPASPIIDSGRAPPASAQRHTSAKMWPAAAPAAFRPCASVAPQASAAAFLAAPASSTPIGSFDSSHTTPARMNTPPARLASDSSVEAATSPAPSLTISRACAGPPMQAVRSAPKRCRASSSAACRRVAPDPWPARRSPPVR